jgi:proline iminopeptidase
LSIGSVSRSALTYALSSFQPDVAGHCFGTLAPAYDLRARLGEVTVPTLAVVGRYDWVCPPAAGRAIADAIPGAELVELADAGHFGFSEEPALFLRTVRSFLARLDPTRRQPRATVGS